MSVFEKFKGILYRRRLNKYQLYLMRLQGETLSLEELPMALSEFWRLVTLMDFEGIAPQNAMTYRVAIHHRNLPELIHTYGEINEHIVHQRDEYLETHMHGTFTEQRVVLLDDYLADDNLMAIPVARTLVKLQGVLLHHRYLLELQGNQYYQRLSQRVYKDTLSITQALVDAL